MNPEQLKQLQDEIEQEMYEALKNLNFGKVLEKYGISGDTPLKFQYILDLTKLQSSDADEGQQVEDFSRAISGKNLVKVAPCLDDYGNYVPCG